MSHEDQVAKIRITLDQGGRRWALMSRKKARSELKHDKLEFLGGHVDPGETPLEALLRELTEEDLSGILVARARDAVLRPFVSVFPGVPHHLFEMTIDPADFGTLVPASNESLGFVLVPATELDDGAWNDRVTPRTRAILRAFGARKEG